MEQNQNPVTPEAATYEPASPRNLQPESHTGTPADSPGFAGPAPFSDCLDSALSEILAETFVADGPRPRHDGWTPDAVAGFLRALAAGGVVEHAARAVGLSAASAYALRNRRQGRAFARMWDAVLIHRSRARIADELQARAVAGCVSIRKRDGVVVGEYHYYDNRLAMSLLTRLDRLAEREAAGDVQLRALSEDLDDYIDCLAAGGDADEFVEARRAPEASQPEPGEPDDDPELSQFARMSGCPDYRDVDARDIEVADLDPTAKAEWSPDQWVRSYRSGFMFWLEAAHGDGDERETPGAPFEFLFCREAARAADTADGEAVMAGRGGDPGAIDTTDLDTDLISDWTEDQLARAWRSGLLGRLPAEFWDAFAETPLASETLH